MEVEIKGYKAKIGDIHGRVGYPPQQDEICVFLDFDKAIEGTSGFYIKLPARPYARDEFLSAVLEEGETVLTNILEQKSKIKEEEKRRGKRQRILDAIVAEIKGYME